MNCGNETNKRIAMDGKLVKICNAAHSCLSFPLALTRIATLSKWIIDKTNFMLLSFFAFSSLSAQMRHIGRKFVCVLVDSSGCPCVCFSLGLYSDMTMTNIKSICGWTSFELVMNFL